MANILREAEMKKSKKERSANEMETYIPRHRSNPILCFSGLLALKFHRRSMDMWVNKYSPKSFLHLLSDEVLFCSGNEIGQTELLCFSAAIEMCYSGSNHGTQLFSERKLFTGNRVQEARTKNMDRIRSQRFPSSYHRVHLLQQY
jgi:hypothetical protein